MLAHNDNNNRITIMITKAGLIGQVLNNFPSSECNIDTPDYDILETKTYRELRTNIEQAWSSY